MLQARVLENMAEGVNVCDENARILFANPAFYAMFGYERGELTGQHVSVLNASSPEENARVVEEITTQLAEVGSWRGEINSKRKDGTPFTTSARISTLEVSGKTYMINVREDITERKRASTQLAESERYIRMLTEHIEEALWLLDPEEYRVLYVSPAYEELWGRTCESLYEDSKDWLTGVHPDDLGRVLAALEEQAETGRFDQEFRVIRPDGLERWVWDRAFAVKDESGQVHHVVGIASDITTRKRLELEDQLRSDRDKLEETVEREMVGKNPYKLTFREFTVLHLAAEGEADKAIADRLGISSLTVSKHMGIILKKMAATSRTEACVRALREGFLT